VEEIKVDKRGKMGGEGGRIGRNLAWWPLSKQGSWTRQGEMDQHKEMMGNRPITEARTGGA
jgi:hypothetical protein